MDSLLLSGKETALFKERETQCYDSWLFVFHLGGFAGVQSDKEG